MAKALKLSATRINTFLQCKLRYWYSYEERLEKMANPVFSLGLACHDTLEKAGNLWKEKGLQKFSKKQIKDLLAYYDEASIKEGIEDHDTHLLGKDLVSYRLNNFSLGEKIVGVEDKFGFPGAHTITTKDGVELIGAIDKAIEIDPETLLIVDYKTSKTVPDNEKLRADIQLSMYNLAARYLYPEYKRYILSLDILRKGEIVYTYRTDDELLEFENYLKVIYDNMKGLKEEDVKPSLNFLCGWCDYSHVCEKYKEMCAKKEFEFLDVGGLDDEKIVSEWEDVKATQKILESRERELADVIMERIKVKETPVVSGDKEMVLRQNARTTYNAQKLSERIPSEDFSQLVTVSPSKLKKYMEKNPKAPMLLEDVSETSFTRAFLATKKIKKDKKK